MESYNDKYYISCLFPQGFYLFTHVLLFLKTALIEHSTTFCLGLGAESSLQDYSARLHLVLLCRFYAL